MVRVAAEAACNILACCCMAEAPVTHEPVLALSLIGLAGRFAGTSRCVNYQMP